jgi:GH15 family glucan-1,4-alpha-glucosidase
MSAPIEDYGMIGDGQTAALVSRTGSIDWLCWPRFDSGACFAALVGTGEHGCWTIGPVDAAPRITRRYQPDTLILETDFETDTGAIRLIDFMPMRGDHSVIVRIVVGLRGAVECRSALRLRFDYGALSPWVTLHGDHAIAECGPDLVVLRAPMPLVERDGGITTSCVIAPGQRLAFSLSYGDSSQPPPPAIDAEAALRDTAAFWHEWIGKFTGNIEDAAYATAVKRSLITLKALIFQPTGGLVAAPTTSLPEIPGGASNWDYRFCWLRDATFTLTALLNAGYHDEARAWRDWMLRALAGEPDKLRIMYRVDGARHIPEWEVPWLPGHNWASPVRIGNAASTQHQADVYGEVLDAFHLAARAGIEQGPRGIAVETAIVHHIEKTWMDPGAGVWESRAEQRHYVYARAMAWVGVDRFLKDEQGRDTVDTRTYARFERLRTDIHAEICREGFHPGLGRFVEYYGGQSIDASLLLLPLIGFLPIDDPRITATIDAVERDLLEGGFVRRKPAETPTAEGAFLACSFWLADCRAMQGNHDAARTIIDRVLSIRNDLGLLSEEYDVPGRRLIGNFPQALSHLALVNSVLGLAGSTLARAAG